MFRFLSKKLRTATLLTQNHEAGNKENPRGSNALLSCSREDNLKLLQDIWGGSGDVVIRNLALGRDKQINATVIYIDGMVNKDIINEGIIKPLLYDSRLTGDKADFPDGDIELVESSFLSVVDVKRETAADKIIEELLYGSAIMLLDGSNEVLVMDCKGWPMRSVEEPETEKTVRGPKEGFTETVRMNTALLRHKIINPDLRIENMIIGERTHTNIALAYINGIVKPELVDEVKRRLKLIKIDAILDSGYIEQLIEDNPLSPFSSVGNSEKPDVVAANIMEGRVAIIVDGSPMVLTVPMLFIEGFQAAEDYYSRPYFSSVIRMLRYLAFIITLLAPPVYVAMTTFHQELIPTPLLITTAASSEGTPFPAVVETIFMMVLYQIIREGGVRLPGPVGSALSIVGALVIGDAAVRAGLVGAPVVIVVAATAVSAFLVIAHTDAVYIISFGLTILAGILGGFGIVIGLLLVFIHMASLRSFGVPYLSPIAPFTWQDIKDTVIRAPLWAMINRPKLLNEMDLQRAAFDLKPDPPDKKE